MRKELIDCLTVHRDGHKRRKELTSSILSQEEWKLLHTHWNWNKLDSTLHTSSMFIVLLIRWIPTKWYTINQYDISTNKQTETSGQWKVCTLNSFVISMYIAFICQWICCCFHKRLGLRTTITLVPPLYSVWQIKWMSSERISAVCRPGPCIISNGCQSWRPFTYITVLKIGRGK